MSTQIAQVQQFLWAVNTAVGVFLLLLLAVRKNVRIYPAFSLYVLLNLATGVLAFFMYRVWGFTSPVSLRIAWGMQGTVIFARALAVAEVCKHLLARYRGIWALASRFLLVCAVRVVLYSTVASKPIWALAVLAGDRAVELAIAVVIVGVLLFARYYHVQVNPADRSLAVGLCLYSCFCVLHNTAVENYFRRFAAFWNLLGMLAFLASLLVWTWALRKPQTETVSEAELLPQGIHQSVAPQINLRLRSLNERLSQLLKPEATQR